MKEFRGTALPVLCFILLVMHWSHCTSVDPLPEKCRSDIKSRPSDVKIWTFCTNTTREWSFDSKENLCANDNDIIYIKDFQLYQDDSTCPKPINIFGPPLPSYNATCLQEENKY
ncbi:unnamed protein product [Lymnaea stagnalis]|uniref:Uncharacterized protein n=1 Tax=Lymnaea stagnalis TaxID=6523 RepID=A0AAV2H0R2_LYMST